MADSIEEKAADVTKSAGDWTDPRRIPWMGVSTRAEMREHLDLPEGPPPREGLRWDEVNRRWARYSAADWARTKEQLYKWFKVLHHNQAQIAIVDDLPYAGEDLRYLIYTDRNMYAISASPTYLKAYASSRKPRAGENDTRGNELVRGQFNFSTWYEILGNIVSYEMVRVHKGDILGFGYHEDERDPYEGVDVMKFPDRNKKDTVADCIGGFNSE